MPLRLVLFMTATLMIPVITQAAGYSTANLLPHCKEVDSFCAGYLVAVVDAEDEIVTADGSATKQFCVPKGVEVEQLSSIFVKYAGAHPDKQYSPAARLARLSLIERYPCR
ncbi:MAG TPA: Rap1a/Tai family immunity protein [Stellaceae bacterium]